MQERPGIGEAGNQEAVLSGLVSPVRHAPSFFIAHLQKTASFLKALASKDGKGENKMERENQGLLERLLVWCWEKKFNAESVIVYYLPREIVFGCLWRIAAETCDFDGDRFDRIRQVSIYQALRAWSIVSKELKYERKKRVWWRKNLGWWNNTLLYFPRDFVWKSGWRVAVEICDTDFEKMKEVSLFKAIQIWNQHTKILKQGL